MDARTCPKCGYRKSVVKDVRDTEYMTRRSRTCPKCGRKWQTVEVERWHYENLRKKGE